MLKLRMSENLDMNLLDGKSWLDLENENPYYYGMGYL